MKKCPTLPSEFSHSSWLTLTGQINSWQRGNCCSDSPPESISKQSVSNQRTGETMCFHVFYFILSMLSHVHKCHGSTLCSQCIGAPLTKKFLWILILWIRQTFCLSVGWATHTQSTRVIMTVRSRVPRNVYNGRFIELALLWAVYRGDCEW